MFALFADITLRGPNWALEIDPFSEILTKKYDFLGEITNIKHVFFPKSYRIDFQSKFLKKITYPLNFYWVFFKGFSTHLLLIKHACNLFVNN